LFQVSRISKIQVTSMSASYRSLTDDKHITIKKQSL